LRRRLWGTGRQRVLSGAWSLNFRDECSSERAKPLRSSATGSVHPALSGTYSVVWLVRGRPMRCSKCETNNPPGNNFCVQCGNALTTVCAKCNAENPPASNFCGKCGTPFDGNASGVSREPHAHPGERRHLTVLFCDLVGSTEIAGRLDPEEWR